MTPHILSFDTTTEFGSVALVRGSDVLEETLLHSSSGFGHILFSHLERLLAKHGWRIEDIDCFAAASGPGSFTGVRVGLAAVKGLAAATQKPVVAVSNLQAVAWFGGAPLRATLLDARRGQVYGAVYSAALEKLYPETVAAFPQWLASLPDGNIEFLSTDCGPFRHALAGTRFEHCTLRDVPRALAGAVGVIAATRLTRGLAGDAAGIDANYVRRSDAELFWNDRG